MKLVVEKKYNSDIEASVHILTDRLVLLAGICSPILLLISSFRYFQFGLHPSFICEIINTTFIVCICLFKRKLSFQFKVYCLALAGLYTASYSIIFYGFIDLGIIYSIVVIVFVATVFSVRQAIIIAVLVLIIVTGFAILHVTKVLSFIGIDSAHYAGSFVAWLLAISNITLSATIVLFIIIMYKRLMSYYTLKIVRHSKNITRQAKRLKKISSYDYLTRLSNRRAFIDDFNAQLKELDSGLSIAMLCVDINRFSNINERYGYEIGDQVIIEYSRKLLSVIKSKNLPIKGVYRVEGDEFVLLTEPITSIESELNQIYNVIKTTTIDGIKTKHSEIHVSVKVCAACYPQHAKSVDELIVSSRLALNYARKKGSELCIYNNSMFENITRRLSIEKKIQKALLESQFYIAVQNIYNIKTKKIVGREALIRWHDDELGDIQPDDFIAIAEQSGQIKDIDYWVIEAVFKNIANEKINSDQYLRYSINVSVLSLSSKAFIDNVKYLQQKYCIDPEQVVFEITEYVIINRYDEISATLTHLKELGYKVSLDDFGTGYSSLSYLANLSVDYLKLDKSFIQSIHQERNKSLMLGIISLVNILGIDMIIEGVETTRQLIWLEEIEYDFSLQGYYFHKPQLISQVYSFYCI